MFPGFLWFFFIVVAIPVIVGVGGDIAKRWIKLKERQLELVGTQAAEKAAQYAAHAERLEQRVRVLERISRFFMAESCGQCTPCREGTGWMNRMIRRILAGQGRQADLDLLLDVANRIEGHTICALGDASAWPVQSFMKHYRHEFQYMIDNGGRSIVVAQPGKAA